MAGGKRDVRAHYQIDVVICAEESVVCRVCCGVARAIGGLVYKVGYRVSV
jgi:hypothetical protein